MPSFTSQIPNLQSFGPVVELQLAVGDAAERVLRAAKKPIPPPVLVRGMIDTGATGSVIQQGLPVTLGLSPVGVAYINTPSSANLPCHEYFVRLLLPNDVVAESRVIEAPLQGQHIQCLIGRDVLAQAVFVYIGYANQFTLSF